ncbi:MAG: glycosyl hydrolase family 8 [Bacteroidales bacterium]|nr:glycosyl hydrolase family 8 [Bacteroidales bacterium]
MKKLLLITLCITTALAGISQNFPFPMNEQGYTYPYGISATNPRNSSIQSKFVAWDKALYTESGDFGRIKFDDTQYTVSEGVAYGMLIYVYMANATNTKCQDHFDKLYAYYKKWSDGHGLMHWKINGFSSINGYNAATDADVDVALALCLAAKQWGKSSKYDYAKEAETILKNIYSYEVTTKNGIKVFKPGDAWDNYGNPCYFTVASVGVFQQAQDELGFTSTRDWASVYSGSHTYLEKSQKNGVWPNWAKWDGSLGTGNSGDADDFGWDACRVPWRVAWDYVWFGNTSSKNMMAKTIALLDAKGWAKSPSSVGFMTGLNGSGYSSISTTSMAGNVSWTGSVGCAFMTDASRQSNLDSYYNQNVSATGGPYYAQTIQILYMLTMSGNAANFYDCGGSATVTPPVVSSATTDGKVIALTCSKKMKSSTNYSGFTVYLNGVAQSNVISSMSVSGNTITLNLKNITVESGDAVAVSYNGTYLTSDQDAALGSVVKMTVKNNVPGGNTILADCENDEVTLLGGTWYSYVGVGTASHKIETGGANSTSHAAHFTYSGVSDYSGMGFNILDEGEPYDLTGSTGITFYHKGSAATLEVATPTTSDYSHHIYSVPSHANWTPVTVNWTDLTGPGWGAGNSTDFNEGKLYSEVIKFQWKVVGSGEFYIDEVTLIGKTIAVSSADKSALEKTLASANSLYGAATTDMYPQSAITTFYKAIDAAATVNMNASATQTEVDNANTTLTKAITTFKAAAYADKSSLQKAIASATTVSKGAVVGTANGQYPQSAKNELDAAIAAAQTTYNKTGLTASEVSAAVTTLNNAVTTFKNSVNSSVDKGGLKDIIDRATNILATTTAGTAAGQYSATSRTALESALKTANTTYNNASATQSTVTAQTNSLVSAYNAYLASKVTETAVDDVVFEMNVYPNPCVDVLDVSSTEEIQYVRIVSVSGVKSVIAVGQTSAQIDVASLAKGYYSLQVVFADGQIKTTKFIKK